MVIRTSSCSYSFSGAKCQFPSIALPASLLMIANITLPPPPSPVGESCIHSQRCNSSSPALSFPPLWKCPSFSLAINIQRPDPRHRSELSSSAYSRSVMDQMVGDGGGFPLEEWFWEMPICTRWWTVATIATSALVQFQLITPFQLFYSFRAVFQKSQVSSCPPTPAIGGRCKLH